MKKKVVSILGSTGTIGINSLEIFQKKKNYLNFTYSQQIKTMI